MKKIFQDYVMQTFYEMLMKEGYSKADAKKETRIRFEAYDNGKDVIFVKE